MMEQVNFPVDLRYCQDLPDASDWGESINLLESGILLNSGIRADPGIYLEIELLKSPGIGLLFPGQNQEALLNREGLAVHGIARERKYADRP